jgi:DNA-directed RNA polymerase subunit RPC12/RpoP
MEKGAALTTSDQPIRCPACGGKDIRSSYPAGWWDKVMYSLGKEPLRCRRCEKRFFHRLRDLPRPAPEREGEGPN